VSVDSDLVGYRDEYDAFARAGGGTTDPNWYPRYTTITRYLADVRQRLRSRPDGASLRPGDIPALPGWGIAEGGVEDFLEVVWHSPDNGVSGLGRGRVGEQYWESIKLFARDGTDLTDLTAAMIRDPEVETRDGRAREWFKAWKESSELPPREPRSVIYRLVAGLEPDG
jgi:hypothetical protein